WQRLPARRAGGRSRRHHARPRPFVPRLEGLEDRTVPSTLTVSNTADSGAGSLRAAIAGATAGDTITFAPQLAGQTINLTSGELEIAKALTITGPGAGITVGSGGTSRVFAVDAGTAVSMSNLTIANGAADQGAGIDNLGTLTLTHCTVTGNMATGDTAV